MVVAVDVDLGVGVEGGAVVVVVIFVVVLAGGGGVVVGAGRILGVVVAEDEGES